MPKRLQTEIYNRLLFIWQNLFLSVMTLLLNVNVVERAYIHIDRTTDNCQFKQDVDMSDEVLDIKREKCL